MEQFKLMTAWMILLGGTVSVVAAWYIDFLACVTTTQTLRMRTVCLRKRLAVAHA